MRRYLDSRKVRGEGNSVVIINREILLGPEDARICFPFIATTRDFSAIQRSILLMMSICEILLFILICIIVFN